MSAPCGHQPMLPAWLAVLACLALGALGATAGAQSLTDPTRPPPESQLLPAGAVADAAPARQGPQLQSVLTGTRGREIAVIDGQTLRRGDKIDGAVLLKVGKDSVTLRRGSRDEVLTLFPKKQ